MHRVKNIEYDEDELDLDDEEYGEEEQQTYTAEDRDNFASLTPVVRAELDEAGLQASDRDIEEALWHYYWDVGKSVAYLKNARTPRPAQQQQPKKEKEKPKSKFDQAAEKSAETAGELHVSFATCYAAWDTREPTDFANPRGGCQSFLSRDQFLLTASLLDSITVNPPVSAAQWFRDTPWSGLPPHMEGYLVPAVPLRPLPKLLGGSSKLAKLAEERRKKAAASQPIQAGPDAATSSLDRLSRPNDPKENMPPQPRSQSKKYPIRKKKEPSPPPEEPSPPPEESKDDAPDLRASPTAFGRTLSTSPIHSSEQPNMTLKDLCGASVPEDPFKGPSPDDSVMRAQASSKGLNK